MGKDFLLEKKVDFTDTLKIEGLPNAVLSIRVALYGHVSMQYIKVFKICIGLRTGTTQHTPKTDVITLQKLCSPCPHSACQFAMQTVLIDEDDKFGNFVNLSILRDEESKSTMKVNKAFQWMIIKSVSDCCRQFCEEHDFEMSGNYNFEDPPNAHAFTQVEGAKSRKEFKYEQTKWSPYNFNITWNCEIKKELSEEEEDHEHGEMSAELLHLLQDLSINPVN